MLLNDCPGLAFVPLEVTPLPPPLEPPLPPPVVVELFETVICNEFCEESPVASDTAMANGKLPLAPGVPEIAPVLLLSSTPPGSFPEVTENA